MRRRSCRRPVRVIKPCRRRRLPVAALGTLVLPPFQGASRKVYNKEPEQGDDGEPHDDHQELPDLRRQNLPLRPTSNRTRCTQSIVHQRRIHRNRVTQALSEIVSVVYTWSASPKAPEASKVPSGYAATRSRSIR